MKKSAVGAIEMNHPETILHKATTSFSFVNVDFFKVPQKFTWDVIQQHEYIYKF
jgi:hypothetical protein